MAYAVIIRCKGPHFYGRWLEGDNYVQDGEWVRRFARKCEVCGHWERVEDRRQTAMELARG